MYRMVGLKIHVLRKRVGGGGGDEGVQFVGRRRRREQHCASMMECSWAVMKVDSAGWGGAALGDARRHL